MDNSSKPDGTKYLRAGIGYFLAWIVVAILMLDEYATGGGIDNMVASVTNGNYSPMVLLAASIVLLALSIRSLSLYLATKRSPRPDR